MILTSAEHTKLAKAWEAMAQDKKVSPAEREVSTTRPATLAKEAHDPEPAEGC